MERGEDMTEKKQGQQDGFVFPTCPGKVQVPTEKEKEALEAMKSIKGQVRSLKARLKSLTHAAGNGTDQEMARVEAELAQLKREWDTWEGKRQKAARERMIALGHEQR
jgi:hypothetical protein